MTARRSLVLLVLLFVLVAIAWPSFSTTLSDWWWFKEVGYEVIFTKEIVARLALFLLVGGLTTAVVYGNLRVVRRGLHPLPFAVQLGPNMPPINLSAVLRRVSLPLALFLGFLFGSSGAASWETALLALNRTPFGSLDPVFQRDISYYVFLLPAISGVLSILAGLTIVTLLLLFPAYLLRGDITFTPPRAIGMRIEASRHVGTVLGILFVLWALQLWFVDAPGLLYSTTGPLVGASYTDLHASLPAIRLAAFAALLAAGLVFLGGRRGHLGKYLVRVLGGWMLLAIVTRALFPLAIQKLIVAPTELTREAPYLQSHIAATRAAWGLDSVESSELAEGATLSLADLQRNAPTIDNVRLWDRDPLLQTFGQLQEIRTYYDFLSVDDDRYHIDGKLRQVLLSPRELNAAALPTRTFINEHLTFTHGMGLTLGPVNQITSEGLPVLFIKDLPPASNVSLKISRPQIYYGEMNYDFAVVGTAQREFDHPAGEENVYAAYAGTGGVPIGSFWRRLVLASRFQTSKLLLSGDITNASRILYVRNIRQRVEKALPFLSLDRDPYLVVADDGRLQWILDAYTTTTRYPYSQRLSSGINYMRNSVKVVLDAYDGSMHAYVMAPTDPLIQTWGRVFPGILLPMEQMPADIRAHIRYPDDLYRIQTALYATYHMDSPDAFYHREDQWAVPEMEEGSSGAVPFMRHIVMRLPGEENAEFVYMVPFTPRGKDNLAAWMVARNDGAAYGKLRAYTFSRQSTVYGPTQIENRINQDTEISRQVSLWDQRGSKVLRGDLLVIPIENSLLYVQPLYLQAEGGKIPELKRVVVAYQTQVVMDESLDGALNTLFGGSGAQRITSDTPAPVAGAPVTTAPPAPTTQALLAEAQRHYDAAMTAQREGNWAKYGEEIKALGQLLAQLRR